VRWDELILDQVGSNAPKLLVDVKICGIAVPAAIQQDTEIEA
jgi:hypothetical protein